MMKNKQILWISVAISNSSITNGERDMVETIESNRSESSLGVSASAGQSLVTAGNVKILIVNDHLVLREGMVSILKDFAEAEIVGAISSLEECVQMADLESPDIILADLATEMFTPRELIQQINEIDEDARVVFLVGRRISDANLAYALEQGVDGLISKEESGQTVWEAIKKVQRGEKFFSSDLRKRVKEQLGVEPDSPEFLSRRKLLSPREIEVLCCVAKGMKAKNIGKHLHITAKTVERHKSNIMAKLRLHSQVDLAIYAIKEGYIIP